MSDFQVKTIVTIVCQAPSAQAGTVHVGFESAGIGLGDRQGTVLRIGRQVLAQYTLNGVDWVEALLYARDVLKRAFERCVIEDGAWSFDSMKRHFTACQRFESRQGAHWDGWLVPVTEDNVVRPVLAPWAVDLRGDQR